MRKILCVLGISMVACMVISCKQKLDAYAQHQIEASETRETEKETEKETVMETVPALIIETETETETETESYVADDTNPYREIFENMTDEEYWLLCKVAQAEGGISTDECMIAVVETVLNRVLDSSKRFRDSIYGVLYQKGEFTSAKYLKDTVVTDRAINAVEYVIENGRTLLPEDYVYFCTRKMPYSKNHIYYGDKYGVGHWYGRPN